MTERAGQQRDPDVPAVGVVAIVRFLSELAMLGALGYVGFQLVADDASLALQLGLALALPAVAAVAWWAWVAPRAPRRLSDPARLGVEIVLFAAAATGLVVLGQLWWAVVLAALYITGSLHGRAGG